MVPKKKDTEDDDEDWDDDDDDEEWDDDDEEWDEDDEYWWLNNSNSKLNHYLLLEIRLNRKNDFFWT